MADNAARRRTHAGWRAMTDGAGFNSPARLPLRECGDRRQTVICLGYVIGFIGNAELDA